MLLDQVFSTPTPQTAVWVLRKFQNAGVTGGKRSNAAASKTYSLLELDLLTHLNFCPQVKKKKVLKKNHIVP